MEHRSRRGAARAAAVGLLGLAALVAPARPATAACHAFTVEAEPATVAEGEEVTVTVSRDANIGPSQIDIETIDGTARGGSDYEAVERRTLSFSTETEQSFAVPTLDDAGAEGAETFRLHLSNPDGCSVNPNFVVGPDAEVTITDNDVAATTQPTAPPTTDRSTTSEAPSRTSTTNADGMPSRTSTTNADGIAAATVSTTTSSGVSTTTMASLDDVAAAPVGADDEDDDDDSNVAAVAIAIVVLLVAAAGGGAWAWRARAASRSS